MTAILAPWAFIILVSLPPQQHQRGITHFVVDSGRRVLMEVPDCLEASESMIRTMMRLNPALGYKNIKARCYQLKTIGT